MGAISDLHLLASEVIESDVSLDEQVEHSAYSRDEIEWAVSELRKANQQV